MHDTTCSYYIYIYYSSVVELAEEGLSDGDDDDDEDEYSKHRHKHDYDTDDE